MSVLILHILYLVAITAEAMTAALAAGRRSMDWVGVCLLGAVTALGGGSARDVLLGHYPLIWVAHPTYLLVTAAAALATIALARFMHRLRGLFLFLDAVGLVAFTVIGCNVAMEMGQPVIVVIVAGMITGCLGGVLRDVLCNEIPLLFRSELYASVSIVTGWALCRRPAPRPAARARHVRRHGLRPRDAAAGAALQLEHAEVRLHPGVALRAPVTAGPAPLRFARWKGFPLLM